MAYTVYIQSLNRVPIDDWGFTAYIGFKHRQMSIVFFEDISEIPISKYSIVVAHIGITKQFLESLNIKIPPPLNIPLEIKPYTKRDIRYMTMKEFKEDSLMPVFIKPHSEVKGFVAGVITKQSSKDYFFTDIAEDYKVEVSEVLDIVSEYRGFVVDKELKALSFYLGDFKVYPDCSIIEKAIVDYTSQPMGYSIDFGVTSTGETILIECNDGWSLGSYGCDSDIYVKLLLKRWIELTKGI